MQIRNVTTGMFMLALAFLAGCGGGDGPVTTPTTVRLATIPKGTITSINGVQLTVVMPDGVTVTPDAQGSYATASGSFAQNTGSKVFEPRYVLTGNQPAKLTLVVGSSLDFPVGEFATFTVKVPAGVTLTKSSFTIQDPVISYSPNAGSVDYVPAGQIEVEPEIVQ